MTSPLTMALAMFVAGVSFMFRPASANDVVNLITLLFATALLWGANGILVMCLWRAWRRAGR